MLSLCGLFSDDFLKCLYLKQLCKIIMLCFQKIVSENSVKIPTRQNLIREVVTSQDHAWWPGYHVGGAITCQGAGRGASCVMSFIRIFKGVSFRGAPLIFPAHSPDVSIPTSLSWFLERGVSSPVSSARLCSQPMSVIPRKTWLCQLFHQPPASPVLHLFRPFSLHLTHSFVQEECRTLGYSARLACGHAGPAHTHPPESPLVWLRV